MQSPVIIQKKICNFNDSFSYSIYKLLLSNRGFIIRKALIAKEDTMLILGFKGFPGSHSHDSAAALVKDGEVIAAVEQERISRNRHSLGEAPDKAIEDCLAAAGVALGDIDAIAHAWKTADDCETFSANEDFLARIMPAHLIVRMNRDSPPQYYNVRHHVAHAASAFYQSGFEDACCLVMDGQGEDISTTLLSASIKDGIKVLRTYPISQSLGLFYDMACYYCGLSTNDAGKLMGLAPFGKPGQPASLSFDPASGTFENPVADRIQRAMDAAPDKKTFEMPMLIQEKYFEYFKRECYPSANLWPGFVEASTLMYYANFAAGVQECLERAVINLAKYLKSLFPSRNLIISGGVSLNCTANGKLDRSEIFENIFAYPASNDSGTAAGAALCVFERQGFFKKRPPVRIDNVYLGRGYPLDETKLALGSLRFHHEELGPAELSGRVAALVAKGKTVAWFAGGAEFGPRALGHRSILANPADRNMLYHVNNIKSREKWRPLSPIVPDKFYDGVFDDPRPGNLSEFMLKTVRVKDDWAARIPAVVHVDGTARPQYLKRSVNPELYDMICEFHKTTGIPCLINTSFNGPGQPIIETPSEALRFLERSNTLDFLVLEGRWLVWRNDNFRYM